ncbi:HNH endonuclease [Staphylococcus aureus]|nr:HNH endonuclease [Staphylococcus aureus]MBG1474168.1 HNH endonuclease [Staphylococcus aureus]
MSISEYKNRYLESLYNTFKTELENERTRYFILDTNYTNSDDTEKEFTWDVKQNNKIREGDLFIFRRPTNLSQIAQQFYFFGAGKIEKIERKNNVATAYIAKPLLFVDRVLKDNIENLKWEFKERIKEEWEQFFFKNKISNITKNDFLKLLSLSRNVVEIESNYINNDISLTFKQMADMATRIKKNIYYVGNHEAFVQAKGSAHFEFSKRIKQNYSYRCAITGIKTKDFLVVTHIIPWHENEFIRLDPSNGICLSLFLAKAFKKGFITFSNSYRVVLSKEAEKDAALYEELKIYENQKIELPDCQKPNLKYLDWHREHIFKN